jgi:glycosyltransferase involved in cell wall biosynthesis
VVATGRIEGLDVFRYLAAADLHVNPSLCESLNMVTVEAAAVGTPTIGTDGAGVEHWIRRHGAGAVVPRGEAGPLGDAIIFSLQHADRLRAWSLALPALAEEFALERIAASLVALLKGDPDEMPHTRQARP